MADENVPKRRKNLKTRQQVSKKPFTISDDGNDAFDKPVIRGPYGFPYAVFALIFMLFIAYVTHVSDNYLPKPKAVNSPADEFSAARARKHLKKLTSFGPKPTGSYANDVQAVNVILNELHAITSAAKKGYNVEIDVQTASGTLAIVRESVFVSLGFTSKYDNVTNVLVKISAKKDEDVFVLANAHYDTVMNTVGASDDTVSCAVLLEIFRAICQTDPANLKHGVIFLFNGAEEGGLAGSHAFVNEHRWKSLVKVVVNVEAAGSGGREFVFQTGPEHPWLVAAYAKAAKYPYGSSVAQEVFDSGVIPSDTDFRVFVKYGNLVGLDLAFVSNGYVYHTRYDDAKSIPSGSIQRAGDNIHQLLLNIANSPYLKDPSEYKHGKSVFFDVLGTLVVHYPMRLHVLLNNLTCLAVLIYVLQRLVRNKFSSGKAHIGIRYSTEHMSLASLLCAICVILISWLLAILFPLGLAKILVKMDVLMTWYSRPRFGVILYGLPSLFGLLLGHFIGGNIMRKITYPSLPSFMCGHLVIHSIILFYLNQKELLSTFLLWLWIICPLILLCVACDIIPFLPEKKDLGLFLLHLLAMIPPGIITLYHINSLLTFFIPLLGRTGTEVPGEYVVAVLCGLSVILMMTYFMNLYQRASNMKKFLVFIGVLSFIPFLYAVSGRLHPYSARNPITPKRLFMTAIAGSIFINVIFYLPSSMQGAVIILLLHILRTFHNPDGSLRKQDSGLWVQPMDYVAFRSFENITFFKNTEKFQCEGSYCGLPYYYSKRKIIRQQWYLRGEKPEGNQHPLSTSVYKREIISSDIVRFTFDITGPDHMNLFLTLKPNVVLHDWSMFKTKDGHIYSMEDHHGGDCHIVFYTHGYYSGSFKFWMEFKRSSEDDELAELGVARHYLHGKDARTKFLNAAIKELPDWICDNSWTSNYDSFLLK